MKLINEVRLSAVVATEPEQRGNGPTRFRIAHGGGDGKPTQFFSVSCWHKNIVKALRKRTRDDLCVTSPRRIHARSAARFEDQRPFDLITVTRELAQLNQLDRCCRPEYVASLIDHAVPENIASYVRTVRRAAVERRVAQQIEL